jgi:hypothetical protein
MNMNKPPDETLKQGRNRSWLLVQFAMGRMDRRIGQSEMNFI